MRRPTALVVAALCGASSVVASPVAGAAPTRASGWVITRTGRGPAILTGKFTGNATSATASATLFALSGRARARRLANAFTTARIAWGADGSPRVYGVDSPCVAACTNPVDGTTELGFSSNGHKLDATVYVAAWDVKDVTIDLTSPGWRKRPWTPSMRTVSTEKAGDAGVRASRTSVGKFTGAEAPGGRYGSVAWAALPCADYGSGSARFAGGVREWPIECGHSPREWESNAGATRWRLTGDATGVDHIVNVLVVVDYPAG